VDHQARMVRWALTLVLALPLGVAVISCADREQIQAERVAAQAAAEAEADAACRPRGAPESAEYDACRQDLEARRAKQAEIDYQKARDFDRVLGGLDDL
jgi:hypothetical protein